MGPNECGEEAGRCLDNISELPGGPHIPDFFTFYWGDGDVYLTGIEMGLISTMADYYDLSIDKDGNTFDTGPDSSDFSDIKYLGWCKNNGRLRHLYAVDSSATNFGANDLTTGELFNTETLNPDAPACLTEAGDELEISEDLSGFEIFGMRGKIECGPPNVGCT